MLQLINVGFNPLNSIAKKTGETMTELRARMSNGLVTFDEVRESFVEATSKGGLFFDMNRKQSETLLGKWSTFKDEVTSALITVGESIAKNLDLKAVTAEFTRMAGSFKDDFLPAINDFIKQAPNMVNALGQIAKAAGQTASAFSKGVTNLQHFAFIATSIASGLSPEETAQNFIEEFAKKQQSTPGSKNITIEPNKTPGAFDTTPWAGVRESVAKAAKMESGITDEIERDAEKFMGGLIRKGIDAMQSPGFLKFGPDREPEARNEVRTLEQGTDQAFQVMRSMVGPQKDKDKESLNELKKQSKLLAEINKKTQSDMRAISVVMGEID
jgi:hypothetical protein